MPTNALDFDYRCAGEARLVTAAGGLRVEVPADPSRSWAMAMNPSLLSALECAGATARMVDAHLVVHPEGGMTAVCQARYLDSAAALRRMLGR